MMSLRNEIYRKNALPRRLFTSAVAHATSGSGGEETGNDGL